MIHRARQSALRKGLNPPHVCFVQANLAQALPIATHSVDLVISNCVINLLPMEAKRALFMELGRVLKPGGRISFSDVCHCGSEFTAYPLIAYLDSRPH